MYMWDTPARASRALRVHTKKAEVHLAGASCPHRKWPRGQFSPASGFPASGFPAIRRPSPPPFQCIWPRLPASSHVSSKTVQPSLASSLTSDPPSCHCPTDPVLVSAGLHAASGILAVQTCVLRGRLRGTWLPPRHAGLETLLILAFFFFLSQSVFLSCNFILMWVLEQGIHESPQRLEKMVKRMV